MNEIKTPSYYIKTFGCQMNVHDSEKISGIMRESGYQKAGNLESADVIIFNTCCIRENADNKLYGHLSALHSMKEENPDLKVVVAGCLAQKDGELIQKKSPVVDITVGTYNLTRIADLLANFTSPVTEILEDFEGETSLFDYDSERDLSHRAFISIQTGCDNRCAFCIVPYVRGPEKSRPFENILDEITRAADAGASEIYLLGQNVNSYGRDITLRLSRSEANISEMKYFAGSKWAGESKKRIRPLFADLLEVAAEVKGVERIRFTSPHPKDIKIETLKTMAGVPQICEQLHLPLQSGSNSILRKMKRGYTKEKYMEKLLAARNLINDLAVTTDIIVGFPSETDEEFEESLEFIADCQYDSAFSFVFSPREHTPAAKMERHFVDPDVISARMEALRDVIERSAYKKHLERVNRTEEVLIDGISKKDPNKYSGRTRQGKLVHVGGVNFDITGCYIDVLIEGASKHYLTGSAIESTLKMPKARKKIPVKINVAALS
jgi:tRNA-2-methylthio-N6-dimethylallyladenosine synthase